MTETTSATWDGLSVPESMKPALLELLKLLIFAKENGILDASVDDLNSLVSILTPPEPELTPLESLIATANEPAESLNNNPAASGNSNPVLDFSESDKQDAINYITAHGFDSELWDEYLTGRDGLNKLQDDYNPEDYEDDPSTDGPYPFDYGLLPADHARYSEPNAGALIWLNSDGEYYIV